MHEARAHEPAARPPDPLGGLDETIDRLRRQACVAGACAAGSVMLAAVDRRAGACAALAAAAWTAVLLVATGILGVARRTRIHEVILSRGSLDRESFVREVGRLQRQWNRERMAKGLERALADGTRWPELLPASRPPPGARNLPANAVTIAAIAAGLRADHVPVRAIVMLDRLMRGGYGSALYGGGADWLRRELGRIRFEIDADA